MSAAGGLCRRLCRSPVSPRGQGIQQDPDPEFPRPSYRRRHQGRAATAAANLVNLHTRALIRTSLIAALCECVHSYHGQVIIWLNGTFGYGKTSTAAELHSLVPSSRVFDPETVGYMLQPNLADHPVSDFQDWPPWRPLVVATATELARFTGQHLIAPQTILVRA